METPHNTTLGCSSASVNQPMVLYEGPIEIVSAKLGRANGIGRAYLDWSRGPHVSVDVTANGQHPFLGFAGIEAVRLPISLVDFPILVTRLNSKWDVSNGSGCTVHGSINGSVSYGRNDHLTEVICQVANLPHLKFVTEENNKFKDADPILLRTEEWEVVIRRRKSDGDVYKELDENGGYAITHTATIRRCDGATFSAAAVADLQDLLFVFLSFVAGRYVNVILPTGYEGATPVWWEWGAWNADDWIGVDSWVDAHHSQVLVQLFPQFAKLRSVKQWKATLRNVIHWYVASNKNVALLETSVVLSQNCLDLLAWEILVQQEHKFSGKQYRTLHVEERIRQLLAYCGIPAPISTEMPGLRDLAKKLNWQDLPHAISEIRHSIVHPDNKSREDVESATGDVYYEAWVCGQWMLELALLRIMGFTGVYADRRKGGRYVGDVSSVPWTATSQNV